VLMRSHIPAWAITYAENGLISSDELVETVGRAKGFRGLYERLFRPARRAPQSSPPPVRALSINPLASY
ncbi:MAG TPA: hypothetical protein VLB68_31615, partial [Pyrinomonadaceae bacterium]|nr:hypothetical protein [Pyrinomonadaceae bacterium]